MYTSATALASSAESVGDSVVMVILITCVLSTISTVSALIKSEVALRFLAAKICSSVKSLGSSCGRNGKASTILALSSSNRLGPSSTGINSSLL